jgi:hypothetical protein
MATTATPTGAEPVNTLSASGSYSGKVRHMKIANNYGTAIFYGDFVKPVAAGGVELDAGTATLTPIGIFVGCSFTDPTTKQLTFSQLYPASTAADDISAYVVDDPNVVFKIQGDATLAQTTMFLNAGVVQTAGSVDFGRSKNALDASTAATTGTLPLRIVEFVEGPTSSVGDTYTDVLCIFAAGDHAYSNATGV